jgi:septal ring factor EnvC (AmiA/AmiB activator)
MHQFRGYPDLRTQRSSDASDNSIWPSFTDIMTVILMVFMLTMVVVIIKNADLIDQIRLSRNLQAEAESRLASNVQVLADLRVRNTDLEEAIRSARMELILLTDEAQKLETSLDIKAAAIARLEGEKEELEENIRLIRLQLSEKEEDLDNAQAMIGGIRDEAERANRELSLQIADLLSQLEKNEATLLTLSDERGDLEMDLARQRQDFSSLEDKYLKLVRPARSSMGKQVASVQYVRRDGQPVYLMKGIGAGVWEELPRVEMFRRLGALKKRLGDELYIKIVIPEDSGLSYNEAWGFTKTVLTEFDYYYIDGW